MAWTDELKAKLIKDYQAAQPTPENSIEIVSALAEELEQSVNGVRMILIQAGVYVKKDAASAPAAGAAGKTGAAKETTKRVSKEDSIAALRAVIEGKGGELDEDILSKLTGKAAIYFTSIISK